MPLECQRRSGCAAADGACCGLGDLALADVALEGGGGWPGEERPGRRKARGYPGLSVPDAGRLARVEIAVTAICADGTVRRAIVETTGRVDADWWEQLAASAHLEVPPPYRPEPGQPVHEVRAEEHIAQVSEGDLAGPLRKLVTAVLAQGGVGGWPSCFGHGGGRRARLERGGCGLRPAFRVQHGGSGQRESGMDLGDSGPDSGAVFAVSVA
jgi:hypothetical protein